MSRSTALACAARVATLCAATLCAATLCAAGCGGSGPRRADTTSGADGMPPLPTPTRGASDTATIATPQGGVVVRADSAPGAIAVPAVPLHWSADTVLVRLAEAGLAPHAQGEVRQPFFDAPGTRIALAGGRAEVQAFVVGDVGAASRATAGLDTTRVSPPPTRIAWPMPPTLVVNNNLAAIVLTRDAALRERVRRALTTHQR